VLSATLEFVLPELPALRTVARKYAEVMARLDLTRGEQPLVLPNGEWFPDTFRHDEESLERLVCRMQGYAGLERLEITSQLLGEPVGETCGTGGCGSGACGPATAPGDLLPRLARTADGYRLEMPPAALRHPIALTATLARMLGAIALHEKGDPNPLEASAELAAVALGFGVLVLEGSYLYTKSCGGPSVGRATVLSCGELALPFALFLAIEDKRPGDARAELSTTQKAAFDEAWALVQSNRAFVERLSNDPSAVASGAGELREARSWLARVLGIGNRRKQKDAATAALEALERGESLDGIAELLKTDTPQRATDAPRATRARMTREDDVAALVDEALAELRAQRQI